MKVQIQTNWHQKICEGTSRNVNEETLHEWRYNEYSKETFNNIPMLCSGTMNKLRKFIDNKANDRVSERQVRRCHQENWACCLETLAYELHMRGVSLSCLRDHEYSWVGIRGCH